MCCEFWCCELRSWAGLGWFFSFGMSRQMSIESIAEEHLLGHLWIVCLCLWSSPWSGIRSCIFVLWKRSCFVNCERKVDEKFGEPKICHQRQDDLAGEAGCAMGYRAIARAMAPGKQSPCSFRRVPRLEFVSTSVASSRWAQSHQIFLYCFERAAWRSLVVRALNIRRNMLQMNFIENHRASVCLFSGR